MMDKLHTEYQPLPRDQGPQRMVEHVDHGLRRTQQGAIQETTVTLASATAAAGVVVVDDTEVPAGRRLHVAYYRAAINGATPWAGTTQVELRDTADVPIPFVIIPQASLIANAVLLTDPAHVQAALALNQGGTLNKGLVLAADTDSTAGSDLVVTVGFYFA